MLKNQTIVMDQLTNKAFTNIFILPSNESQMTKLDEAIKIYEDGYAKHMKLLEINPFLDYFSTFLYILAVLTEDRNAATESKCQKFFSVGDLVMLLKKSKNCWYLRRNIMLFYFHVYCETEMEISEFQGDYNQLSEFVIDDWHEIC